MTIRVYLLSILLAVSFGCNTTSPYESLLRSELTKTTVHRQVFMGVQFGDPEHAFYEHCREMNRKGVFMQGTMNGGIAVQLRIDALTYPATMDFYPRFENNRIIGVRGKIKYNAWAPWNKHLYADKLLPDVAQLFKKWYGGNDFIILGTSDTSSQIKLDSNRRIAIKRADDLFVDIEFADMSVKSNREDDPYAQ